MDTFTDMYTTLRDMRKRQLLHQVLVALIRVQPAPHGRPADKVQDASAQPRQVQLVAHCDVAQ